MKVKLDLNNPDFQKEWFALSKDDFNATILLQPTAGNRMVIQVPLPTVLFT